MFGCSSESPGDDEEILLSGSVALIGMQIVLSAHRVRLKSGSSEIEGALLTATVTVTVSAVEAPQESVADRMI